ncbi:MAG: hypothetical protein JOZ07_07365 [Solirubrobacterales bacterium]|nr:hypothetical protein [Solirubrobacterales bacterium]
MSYVVCPRCGLSLRVRYSNLVLEHCPRCLARRGVATPMRVIERPPEPDRDPDAPS